MDWIEVTDSDGVEIDGDHYPQGYRLRMAYRAALPLVSGARAAFVSGPYPGRDGPGLPTRPIDEVDWTAIDGIGEETVDEIETHLDDADTETVEVLLAGDLTDLPQVGPDLAETIRVYLS